MADAVSWCISACCKICSLSLWILHQIVESMGNFTIFIISGCSSRIAQYIPMNENLNETNKCHKVKYSGGGKKTKLRLARERRVTNNCKQTLNNLSKAIKLFNSELERNLEKSKKITVTFEYLPETKESDIKISKTDETFSSPQSASCEENSEELSESCAQPSASNGYNETKLKCKQTDLNRDKREVSNSLENFDSDNDIVDQSQMVERSSFADPEFGFENITTPPSSNIGIETTNTEENGKQNIKSINDTVSLIKQSKEDKKSLTSTLLLNKKYDSVQSNILLKDSTSNSENVNEECEEISKWMLDKTKKYKAANYKDNQTLYTNMLLEKSENMLFKIGRKCKDSLIQQKKPKNARVTIFRKKGETMRSKLLKRKICQPETIVEDDNRGKSKILSKIYDSPLSKSLLYKSDAKIISKCKLMKNIESENEITLNPYMQNFLQENVNQKKMRLGNEKNIKLRSNKSPSTQKSCKEISNMVPCTDYYNFEFNSSVQSVTGSNVGFVASENKNKEMYFENNSLTSDFLKNPKKITLFFDTKVMHAVFDFNDAYSIQNLNITDSMFVHNLIKNGMSKKDIQTPYDFQSNIGQTRNYPIPRLPMYWDKMLTDGKCKSSENSKISIFTYTNDPIEIQNVVPEDLLNQNKESFQNHDENAIADPKTFLIKEHDNKHTHYPHIQDIRSDTRDTSKFLTKESDTDLSRTESSSVVVPGIFDNSPNKTEDQKLNSAEIKLKNTLSEKFKAIQSSKHHRSVSTKNKSIGNDCSQSKDIPHLSKSTTKDTVSKEKLNDDIKYKNQCNVETKITRSVQEFKTPSTKFKIFGDEIALTCPALHADPEFFLNVRQDEDIKTCVDKKLNPKKFEFDEECVENRWDANDIIFYCNVMECELTEENFTNSEFCSLKQSLGVIENAYNPMKSFSPVCDGISVIEKEFSLGKRVMRCFSSTDESTFSNDSEELKIVKTAATSPPKRRKKLLSSESSSEKPTVEYTADPSKITSDSSKCSSKMEGKVPTFSQKISNPHMLKEKSKNSKKTKSVKHATNHSKIGYDNEVHEYKLNDELIQKTHADENLLSMNTKSEDNSTANSEVNYMASILEADYDIGEYRHRLNAILQDSTLDSNSSVTEPESDSKETNPQLDSYEMIITVKDNPQLGRGILQPSNLDSNSSLTELESDSKKTNPQLDSYEMTIAEEDNPQLGRGILQPSNLDSNSSVTEPESDSKETNPQLDSNSSVTEPESDSKETNPQLDSYEMAIAEEDNPQLGRGILQPSTSDSNSSVTEPESDSEETEPKLDWYEMTIAEEERLRRLESGEFQDDHVSD